MLNIAPLHVRPTLLTYARAAKAQARASRFRPLVRAHGLLFAIMGYILDATELVGTTAPALAARMRAEGVDAAALVPA